MYTGHPTGSQDTATALLLVSTSPDVSSASALSAFSIASATSSRAAVATWRAISALSLSAQTALLHSTCVAPSSGSVTASASSQRKRARAAAAGTRCRSAAWASSAIACRCGTSSMPVARRPASAANATSRPVPEPTSQTSARVPPLTGTARSMVSSAALPVTSPYTHCSRPRPAYAWTRDASGCSAEESQSRRRKISAVVAAAIVRSSGLSTSASMWTCLSRRAQRRLKSSL
mmetsp:Transcript_46251/g.128541  ORF Transcript_46251/g.128541 Transcript_46251/m.128541 type:complete len:233 (-) Transcript_46251:64-762(-)